MASSQDSEYFNYCFWLKQKTMLILSGIWDSKWEDCSPGSSSLPGPTCVPEPAGWEKKELWFASFDRIPEIILATVRNHIRILFSFPEQRCYIGSNIGSSAGEPWCHAALPVPLLPWKGQCHLDRGLCQDRSKPTWLPLHNFNWDFWKWPEVHPSVIVLNSNFSKFMTKRMCIITFANM